LFEYYQQIRSS